MNTIDKIDMIEAVRPLVATFLKKMTPTRMGQFKEGSPDLTTVKLLAELMLELVGNCAQSMLTVLRETAHEVNPETVKSALGGTLEQLFAQELKVKDLKKGESSYDLTELIAEEVAAQVNLELSGDEMGKCCHLTPPTRLGRMTECASNMIRGFILKLKAGCKKEKKASSESNISLNSGTLNDISSLKFFGSDISDSHTVKDDSVITASPKDVRDLIEAGINEMLKVLEDDLAAAEYEHVTSYIEVETDTVVEVIVGKIKDQEGRGMDLKKKCQSCIKQVGKVIREFFTRVYFKVAIISACVQLRKKYKTSEDSRRASSVESVIARVDTLFEGTDENGKAIGDYKGLMAVSKGENEDFLNQLQVVMISAISETMDEPIFRKSAKNRVRSAYHGIRDEVNKKIRTLIGLLKYWICIHAKNHKDRMVIVLTGDYRKSVACAEPCYDLQREDIEKANMTTTILSLVSLLLKKSSSSDEEISLVLAQHSSWLIEAVWAELKGSDFNIPPHAMAHLPKMMYRVLRAKFGSADNVLCAIIRNDMELISYLEKCFTVLPKVHKKPSAMGQFCSFVGRILT